MVTLPSPFPPRSDSHIPAVVSATGGGALVHAIRNAIQCTDPATADVEELVAIIRLIGVHSLQCDQADCGTCVLASPGCRHASSVPEADLRERYRAASAGFMDAMR